MTGAAYSRDQKIAELQREIGIRKRVYPRWVDAGTLKPGAAEVRIAILEAILHDYESQQGTLAL